MEFTGPDRPGEGSRGAGDSPVAGPVQKGGRTPGLPRLDGLLIRWYRWSQAPAQSRDDAMRIFDELASRLGPGARAALMHLAMNLYAGVTVWSTLRTTRQEMDQALAALAEAAEAVEIPDEPHEAAADDDETVEISVNSEYAANEVPVHMVTSAAERPLPATTSPSSVWALAAGMKGTPQANHGVEAAAAPSVSVQRQDGVTSCAGHSYPQREPPEVAIERERERRARQTPPRPTAAYTTRSKKLRRLIGDGDEN